MCKRVNGSTKCNQRRHRETGQTPAERFQLEALRALPVITPDLSTTLIEARFIKISGCRSTAIATACRPRICRPPSHHQSRCFPSLSIYDQQQEIVSYPRCWQRGEVLGAERFQKNCSTTGRGRAVGSTTTLDRLAGPGFGKSIYGAWRTTDRSLARQVRELLALIR